VRVNKNNNKKTEREMVFFSEIGWTDVVSEKLDDKSSFRE